MCTASYRLLVAVLFIALSGCATSRAPALVERSYDVTFDEALSAVVDVIEEMNMEIESASRAGTQPYVITASYTSDSIRQGVVTGDSKKQTLTIAVRQIGSEPARIRVEEVRSSMSYLGTAPREMRSRLFTSLDRRLTRVASN